ncbi:hypothetical protein DOTSEDRAFT_83393 [Dothistroma septosporum NZE10]|uniref:F-box domain-containing protein n=1 Tax=Dothistroma septosporum (strain NZE10 / CBS 128990) TaxID=675120 RepID=M2YIB0_DOTSN|nr:hypothetical protein DOTSEDRAFT_83393 [Dothistroma septosporum NZE10]
MPPFQPQSAFGKQLLLGLRVAEQSQCATPSTRPPTTMTSYATGRSRPVTFFDLPGEIRNLIWSFCFGCQQIDMYCTSGRAERIAQACPEVRAELESLYYENHIFMFNLRNIHIGQRVAMWRTWMAGVNNDDASRLRFLMFYFPNFTLKASIIAAPLALNKKLQVIFDFQHNPTDWINRSYPPWLQHAADSRIELLSQHLCRFGSNNGRFGRWGIDRIAKIAFGMVA